MKNKQAYNLIIGGGTMGKLICDFDWSKNELGPVADWPQTLRNSVNIILNSPVPMVILWGDNGIMIYNHGYSIIAGNLHPSLLGAKVVESWPQAADFNQDVLRAGLAGKTLFFKDQELVLHRGKSAETVWMDLNYSPIYNDSNKPVGVLAVVVETTERVLIEKKQHKTEDSLKLEREQFQMMADNIPNLVWIADAKGWIYWYNRRWYKYTGTTPKDMEGWGWQSVHDPEMLPHVLKTWKKSIKNGVPFEMVFPLKGADGVFKKFLTRVQPVKNKTGLITHWFGTNTDISEQLASEERQLSLSNQLIDTIESMGDAFFILDENFNIVRVNKMQEKLSQKTRDKTLGKNFWKLFPATAEKHSKYWVEYHKVMKTRKPSHFTDHYAPLNLWTEVDAYPTDHGGISVFFRDVSEQKNAEIERHHFAAELENEKNRLAEAFEFAPAFIAVMKGDDHRFVMANKSFYQLIGHREIIGKSVLEALPEISGQGFLEALDGVYRSGKPFESKEQKAKLQVIPGGELTDRYVDLVYQPMKNTNGTPSGIYIFGYDVTELVTARQLIEDSKAALKDSEIRFRTLIEKSTDAIQLVDTMGQILYSSESIKNVLGYTPKELQNSGVTPYLHPDDTEFFYKKFTELIEKPKSTITMQYRVKHKDGTWAWLETTAVNHLHTPNIKALVGTFRNITDRKYAEETLEQQLQVTRALTDTATACLFMIDGNGLVTFMNPAAQQVTGFSQKEAIGKPMHALVHHSHHNGTPYPEADCPLVDTYKYGKKNPLHEDIFFRKNGTQFNALIVGTPIPGANGIQGTVVEFRDITEEKNAQKELRELIKITEQRNALIRINKTKDEFIGMASHQLRTPATAVKQYLGLVLDEFAGPLSFEQRNYIKIAYDSNERELNIINDLLKTAQMSADKYHLHKESHNITQIIEECVADLRISFKQRRQEVVFDKPSKAIKILLDKTEVKLALTNLLENASKYSYPDTEITIDINIKYSHLEIAISDSGVGIDEENQQRIFDKFTRVDNDLSDTVNGTGLGLYWVKQIVTMHGGSISLKSIAKKGSTFTIKLPM